MSFISGIPFFAPGGESIDKGPLALPFIRGMLPLIGGQMSRRFFKPVVSGLVLSVGRYIVHFVRHVLTCAER
jgi:hypothetical protein